MQIDNIFQMNDWKINKFLKVILSIQISVLGLVLLDNLGVHIPILREIISTIYLLFVPGVLILRIMKMHKLDSVESLLYSVGISIASIMLIGFAINLVYPILKISNPISTVSLLITMAFFVVFLSILSYLRDKDFSEPTFIDTKELLSPTILFLSLFPFLAIIGTYLMNWHKTNIFLILLIILICLIVLLFAYGKIPKKFYPFTIFIVAISLLYHISLISNYVTGWDIQGEYYLADLVIKNAFWNFKLNSTVNAMLSITMVGPIFSIISKISLDWVFKIIYPLIFSLVPLGLYNILKRQTNSEIAFLSAFFFIFLFVFYTEMIALARQEIAEFFLVLLIMLMINKEMEGIKRSFLFIVFGVSLVISHYGLSYIYMLSLFIVYILIWLSDRYDIQKLINFIFKNKHTNHVAFNKKYNVINSTFMIFFITFTIAWYMYVSNSAPLTAILNIGNNILSSISTDFLNPNSVQGLSVIQTQLSTLHMLGKYVHLLSQFFIIIGLFALLSKRNRMNFTKEYLAFLIVNFAVLLAAITLPFFSSSLNTERLYQINLILLAPLCVTGGITVLKIISNYIKPFDFYKISLKLISIFLVFYLLFNTGFVYYVFNDGSTSISLNKTMDSANYNQKEIMAVEWMNTYGFNSSYEKGVVIADEYRTPLTARFKLPVTSFSKVYENRSNWEDMDVYLNQIYPRNRSVYLFFGTRNVFGNSVMIYDKKGVNVVNKEYKSLNNLFFVENKLYDNNGSEVYNLVRI